MQQDKEGQNRLTVLVSGATCAGCIQKIESRLAREPDVSEARLNFSTRRLSIEWRGNTARSNDFVKAVKALGYGVLPFDAGAARQESENEEKFLLLCLGVAGFAMGNIMMISVGLWASDAETMGLATRDLMHWISALIALPAIAFSGRVFFRSAFKALLGGHTNMDVPISLALLLASGMSLFETFHHGEHVYFDSAVMLMFFLLVGRYLDFRARKNARSTATDLLSTLSGFANVLQDDGSLKTVPIRSVAEGMRVRVNAGDKFPVDGHVIEGSSLVDTSLVTGESLPRDVEKGSDVYAGTMNLSAPLTIEVAKAAEDSLLADIVRLMEKAGQGQAQYVRLADRAARLYTPVVHTLAGLAFFGWWLIGGLDWQSALMIAITVLIITCPCALGLAVPVVQVLASGRLMKGGILLKSGDALERLSGVDMALFDKTGTLTLGRPQLEGIYPPEALQMAASIASHSTHPLSKALAAHYEGPLLPLEDVHEHPGQGLSAAYEGKAVRLGRRDWCASEQNPDDPAHSGLELWLSVEGQRPQRFILSDQPREDARSVIERLQAQGVEPVLLSGDRDEIVQAVAKNMGISQAYGGKTPPEKFEILEGFKAQGHKVLMIGDGLNDAPVLAGADVSMAPGSAIDMAQNAADIVFMGDRLSPVYESLSIARHSQSLVKQNFALAVAYNMVAIPLALGGFVTPLIAALAMSGSSLLVIANSFRLKWTSL
ncbi:MAG: cadmium-translocating P-type ATPase [Alphaproteobacteria bacterium]|nr:cadmium-translocating P-type ATPase [Alphaproteobacteria bacterium]